MHAISIYIYIISVFNEIAITRKTSARPTFSGGNACMTEVEPLVENHDSTFTSVLSVSRGGSDRVPYR